MLWCWRHRQTDSVRVCSPPSRRVAPLLLLLEFQSGVDRAMAARMLTYSGLLYQWLVAECVLRERGALSPVLPVVIYNGRSPWTAPADVSELIAAGGAALVRYQPLQQYFLLDEGRLDSGALPPGNWCRH